MSLSPSLPTARARSPQIVRPEVVSAVLLAAMLIVVARTLFVNHTAASTDTDARGLMFVPNAGQLDPAVRFQSTAMGGALFFAPDEVVLALPEHSPQSGAAAAAVLRLGFVGANPAPAIVPSVTLPGRFNALYGPDARQWRTGLPTYAALTYQGLYPGVDLRYEGVDGNLKSTYQVAPGADPRQIALRYQGAQSLALAADGSLVIGMPDGRTISEHAPVAWQELPGGRSNVAVRFALDASRQVRFALGAYDPALALTIDPTLDYSTYLRGTTAATDAASDVATATVGGVSYAYVTGLTFSTTFPSSGTATALGSLGQPDVFVMQIDPSAASTASVIYTTVIGGNGTDSAQSIVAQDDGRVFVAGSTSSPDFPMAAAHTLDTSFGGGGSDAFVFGLSPDGATLEFATYLGGAGNDAAYGLDGDSASLAVAGVSNSPAWLIPTARTGLSNNGGDDAFVMLLDAPLAAPVASYLSYLGGNDSDGARAVALNGGQIFFAGWTRSFAQPMPVTVGPPKITGDSDAFVARVDPAASGAASLVYSRLLGGASDDMAYAVRVDSAQQAFVVGETASANFPTTPGAFQPIKPGAGGTDAFVASFSAGANGQPAVQAATYLGGAGDDSARDLALAPNGTLFITGATESAGFGSKSLQPYGGSSDAFVSKLPANLGSRFYTTYLGGAGSDASYGIAVDAASKIYIAGTTNSPDYYALPPVPAQAGFETAGGGASYGTDGFFARLVNTPPSLTTGSLTVAEGGTAVLTTAALDANDADDDLPALVFTVTTAPANGGLALDPDGPGPQPAQPLDLGATFSYADLLAGRVSYTHGGTETLADSFEVTVGDGTDTVGPQTVLINITPADDAPTVSPQTFSVAENSSNGTSVGTVAITDPDGPPPSFTIIGGSGSGVFAINPATGEITVANAAALDFEVVTSFTLDVQVTSGAFSPSATMTIMVTNVNEPPTIAPQTFSVAENSPNGTPVGTVVAGDPDTGTALTYSITGGNIGGAFAIDPATGQISVANAAALDFESMPSFSLSVQVSDGTFNASATITINLINANDPPLVTITAGTASFTENGAPVAIDPAATVTDLDSIDFDAGSLTVAVASVAPTDELTINNQGSGPGQIGLSGATVT
jgi:hypothetical protein